MNYISRKDGGKYVGNVSAELKKGRTFIFRTKEEAKKRFPDEEPIEKYGSWAVTV